MEVLKDNKDKFGDNFDKNKEVLNSLSIIRSKMLKNELAGYITRLIKNELRNETEKTESAENEEQISEDVVELTAGEYTESTKDESNSEVIVEEPSKDESTSEIIVEESSATTKLQD